MSENLDLVRSIYAVWERGDFSAVEWAHPEIVYVKPDGPDPGSWTGVAGMREAWRTFLSAWEDVRAEVHEFRELDDERVLVLVGFSARGKASGIDVAQLLFEGAHVMYIRDSKVVKFVIYSEREQALADLGLEEYVEIVRRAWEASMWHDNEAVFRLYDPEVEIHDVFYDRVYRGLDGVREFFREWVSTFDEFAAQVEEWIDAGDDVIAVLRSRGRGKRSGIPVDEAQSHVWTLRDGKLWRLRVFASKTEALKAVGLEE